MLFAILGGVAVGLLFAGSVALHYYSGLGVPSRDLRRKWRRRESR